MPPAYPSIPNNNTLSAPKYGSHQLSEDCSRSNRGLGVSCSADSMAAISDTFPYRWYTASMISFLAGKPNPSTFPFESITMKIKPGVHGHDESAASSSQPHEITISGDRLAEALQYGATAGLPSLVKVE
jgi:hypothetical protein